MKLMIKVKEIKNIRRDISFIEECCISIVYRNHRSNISHVLYLKCREYLGNIGYVTDTYDSDKHEATFKIENEREMTVEEYQAWYELQAIDCYIRLKAMGINEKCCQKVDKRKYYLNVLKDVEIIAVEWINDNI
jgi:hypothetical protein